MKLQSHSKKVITPNNKNYNYALHSIKTQKNIPNKERHYNKNDYIYFCRPIKLHSGKRPNKLGQKWSFCIQIGSLRVNLLYRISIGRGWGRVRDAPSWGMDGFDSEIALFFNYFNKCIVSSEISLLYASFWYLSFKIIVRRAENLVVF